MNEIVIKGDHATTIHLNISIGTALLRGSAVTVYWSALRGSTAYNYSLGGIVDPRLTILQITPIAPMNTTAYRSFTSSVPKELAVTVHPEAREESESMIIADGMEHRHSSIDEVTFGFSQTEVKWMRFEDMISDEGKD